MCLCAGSTGVQRVRHKRPECTVNRPAEQPAHLTRHHPVRIFTDPSPAGWPLFCISKQHGQKDQRWKKKKLQSWKYLTVSTIVIKYLQKLIFYGLKGAITSDRQTGKYSCIFSWYESLEALSWWSIQLWPQKKRACGLMEMTALKEMHYSITIMHYYVTNAWGVQKLFLPDIPLQLRMQDYWHFGKDVLVLTIRAENIWKICQINCENQFCSALPFKLILPAHARLEPTVAALLCTRHSEPCLSCSVHQFDQLIFFIYFFLHSHVLCCVEHFWWWQIFYFMGQLQQNRRPLGLATPY